MQFTPPLILYYGSNVLALACQCNILILIRHFIKAIPRTIWLDGDGKRLLQWPIEEVESLRRNEVSHQGLELKKGDLFEIKGTDTLQASSNLPQQKYYVFFFADTVANMAHHFLEAGRCGDRF
jgi:hypothetical protein